MQGGGVGNEAKMNFSSSVFYFDKNYYQGTITTSIL